MIQFISHKTERIDYLEGIEKALEGGCRWVQLRMKEAKPEDIIETGKQARRLCDKYSATLIIDDHVELVKETGADGVHLGKNDMPVDEARRVLGEEFIIGGTANTFEDIERLASQGADYIGCGPFRFTTTKKVLAPILALQGYSDITARMKAEGIDIPIIAKMEDAGIDLPVVAIGGITADDIDEILATGVRGIALSSTILRAENPVEEMRFILEGRR